MENFKKDIDSNTIIIGDFNTPLIKKDGSSKENISKDIAALNNVLDQMDLTDVYSYQLTITDKGVVGVKFRQLYLNNNKIMKKKKRSNACLSVVDRVIIWMLNL